MGGLFVLYMFCAILSRSSLVILYILVVFITSHISGLDILLFLNLDLKLLIIFFGIAGDISIK
jgi:hypothetical protein